MMKEIYHKILSLLEGKEKIEFSIFYDKALEDADTVARLEEEIGKLKREFLAIPIDSPAHIKVELTLKIRILALILFGDKPDDKPADSHI